LTVGRWTWKPSSYNECVAAHQPRDSALKMDGAKTVYLYTTMRTKKYSLHE